MSSDLWPQVLLLIVLLALSALFSSAETALVGCNRIRIATLAAEGNKKAVLCEKIFSHESKMLSAILIGNNLVNTFMASIASMVAYTFGGYAVSIATFLITFLILVFGEITPKTIAAQNAEKIALMYAPYVYTWMKLLTPIIWLINLFAKVILKLIGIKESPNSSVMTENEIRTIVDLSHEEGMIEEDEKEMINNVFDFTDAKAKDIMVPRVHVVMVDVNAGYDELMEIFRREKFTRMPVYEEDEDNVIGIINMKDLLFADEPQSLDLKSILRPAYFTTENKSVSDLLSEMKKSMFNLAVVIDEYGEVAGIVSAEDIIEEIVGNLHDEYDQHEMENIRKVGSNTWIVKGYLSLHDLNDALDLDLECDDFDSCGGLMIDKLGRFPHLHDVIELDNGIIMEVVEQHQNRIEEIKMILPEKTEEKQ